MEAGQMARHRFPCWQTDETEVVRVEGHMNVNWGAVETEAVPVEDYS
jgi:hypothetical protein